MRALPHLCKMQRPPEDFWPNEIEANSRLLRFDADFAVAELDFK